MVTITTTSGVHNIANEVDISVEEALLLAEFIGKVHQNLDDEMPSAVDISPEQFLMAKKYLEKPIPLRAFGPFSQERP